MFNIGTGELLVIGLIALIVLGPDKLPQAARQLGQFTSEARKIANGFRQEMKSAMDEVAETPATTDDRVAERQLASAPTDAEPIDVEPVEARPLTPPGELPTGRSDPTGGAGNGSRPSDPPAAGTDDQARS